MRRIARRELFCRTFATQLRLLEIADASKSSATRIDRRRCWLICLAQREGGRKVFDPIQVHRYLSPWSGCGSSNPAAVPGGVVVAVGSLHLAGLSTSSAAYFSTLRKEGERRLISVCRFCGKVEVMVNSVWSVAWPQLLGGLADVKPVAIPNLTYRNGEQRLLVVSIYYSKAQLILNDRCKVQSRTLVITSRAGEARSKPVNGRSASLSCLFRKKWRSELPILEKSIIDRLALWHSSRTYHAAHQSRAFGCWQHQD